MQFLRDNLNKQQFVPGCAHVKRMACAVLHVGAKGLQERGQQGVHGGSQMGLRKSLPVGC